MVPMTITEKRCRNSIVISWIHESTGQQRCRIKIIKLTILGHSIRYLLYIIYNPYKIRDNRIINTLFAGEET